MKRLSFVLPDFTRLAWVNDEERELWEPRINRIKKAWKDVELESVRAGLRPCSLVHLSAADLPREAGRWASKGLALLPVSVDGVSKYGYASSTVPYQPGKPFSHRVVLGTPQNVENFKKRWSASDNAGIGELLGYPECCTEFFQKVYVKDRLVDSTWPMAIRTVGTEPDSRRIELTAPPGANILWRWMGVRMVPHLPCSFNCDRTTKFADSFQNLAVESGYGDEVAWAQEVLSWSVEWSALHGIAEIKTPLLKVTTRTDSTAQKYVVRLRGTAKLEGRVEGLSFPNLGMVKNLEPPWFNFDNGFSSRQLMAASHAPIVELVTSLYEGRSASVLDLGCGNGALLATIREKNHRITPYGIDLNRGRIEHASLVLPEFRENFVAGDLFEQAPVWSKDRRYDLALLMLGRLTETDAEHVIFLKRQVERHCDKLLVYAYGDWIRRYDGLEGLAERVGVHLLSERHSQSVSLAEFGTEIEIRSAKAGRIDSRKRPGLNLPPEHYEQGVEKGKAKTRSIHEPVLPAQPGFILSMSGHDHTDGEAHDDYADSPHGDHPDFQDLPHDDECHGDNPHEDHDDFQDNHSDHCDYQDNPYIDCSNHVDAPFQDAVCPGGGYIDVEHGDHDDHLDCGHLDNPEYQDIEQHCDHDDEDAENHNDHGDVEHQDHDDHDDSPHGDLIVSTGMHIDTTDHTDGATHYDSSDTAIVTITPSVPTVTIPGAEGTPTLTQVQLPQKSWSWGQFWGWTVGGVVGGGLGGLIINGWTGAGVIPCAVAGAVGGAVAGGLGQTLSYLFDDPRIRWNPRSAFLFSLWFTLFFSMLFGLLALPLEKTAVATGPFNWVTFGVAGISAFLATTLPGILNNLRDTEEARPPPKNTAGGPKSKPPKEGGTPPR